MENQTSYTESEHDDANDSLAIYEARKAEIAAIVETIRARDGATVADDLAAQWAQRCAAGNDFAALADARSKVAQ